MSAGAFSDFEARATERFSALGGEIDVSAMVTLLSLVRAVNRIMADMESTVYRDYGVSYAGFRVLFTVWLYGPLMPKEIAKLSSSTRASISSALNTLERDGLVSRRHDSSDRRLVTVSLTERGVSLMEESAVEHNRREQAWVSCLDKSQRETLTELLHVLLTHRPPAKSGLRSFASQHE